MRGEEDNTSNYYWRFLVPHVTKWQLPFAHCGHESVQIWAPLLSARSHLPLQKRMHAREWKHANKGICKHACMHGRGVQHCMSDSTFISLLGCVRTCAPGWWRERWEEEGGRGGLDELGLWARGWTFRRLGGPILVLSWPHIYNPRTPPTQSNRKKIGQWSKAHARARRHVCKHLQTHAPVSTQKNHSLPSAPLPAPLRPPNTATHSLWTETTGLRTGFKRATQHKKHKNIKCN